MHRTYVHSNTAGRRIDNSRTYLAGLGGNGRRPVGVEFDGEAALLFLFVCARVRRWMDGWMDSLPDVCDRGIRIRPRHLTISIHGNQTHLHERAEGGGRVEGRDAGPARAEALGEGTLCGFLCGSCMGVNTLVGTLNAANMYTVYVCHTIYLYLRHVINVDIIPGASTRPRAPRRGTAARTPCSPPRRTRSCASPLRLRRGLFVGWVDGRVDG